MNESTRQIDARTREAFALLDDVYAVALKAMPLKRGKAGYARGRKDRAYYIVDVGSDAVDQPSLAEAVYVAKHYVEEGFFSRAFVIEPNSKKAVRAFLVDDGENVRGAVVATLDNGDVVKEISGSAAHRLWSEGVMKAHAGHACGKG